jgi:alcohol dehydrogenase (cytochrome c)
MMANWKKFLGFTLVAALVCGSAARASTSNNVPTYNGSYSGDRYSTLTQIDRQNVARLRPVCSFQLGKVGPMQSSLIVQDGAIYFTQDDETYAIDARNCKQIWHSSYVDAAKKSAIANRGVAYLDGVLYRGTMDAHLIALDAKTGKTLWDVPVADTADGSAVSGSPIAWNGKIFLGLSGAESGVRGKIMAFSTTNGTLLWTFDTVPAGSEAGADTWGTMGAAATGGGSWWTSATLDPTSGTVYFPIGNPAPDSAPASRPGANLYTNSEVALDANTGLLRWYFQLVPNDYHDWDTTVPPAMFTAANGKPMLAFAGKDGNLFLLDAVTHGLVAKVPVTTITNADKPITPEGTYFCPNMGVQWNGPAYSERDKLVYINSVDWCSTIKLGVAHYVKGGPFLGSTNGSGLRGDERTGWLHAVDPTTGKIAWQYHADGPMVAGITTTASGLLFTGEYTGLFDAFDSSSGKTLYQFQTGAPMAGGVVTYAVGGKQYVAASSGNTSVASLHGGGAGTVYVFSL